MVYDLNQIENEAKQALESASNAATLEELRIKYLGSKGLLKDVMAAIKDVAKEDKRSYGQRANELKKTISDAYEAAKSRAGSGNVSSKPSFDITRPGLVPALGREHPITATIREISSILERLGFKPVEGPEVEDPFHNFDALNIPAHHPARGEDDNFFLQHPTGDETKPVDRLLRSQTSTIQIRAMEKYGVPLRISACGRCYRPDTVDATHHYMFHQIEVLAVDKGITLRDLKGILEYFVKEYFGSDTKFRLRPHYFPFTEISAEIDISCKQFKKEWLELGGCGVVDPNVLKSVGVGPEVYTGFAWGLGIERMFMLRHGMDDIRHFMDNDVRFLHQF